MAGRISWQISLDGLDQQIVKLKTLDSLLNAISRKGGLGGGPGGGLPGSGGVGGVPPIVPVGGPGSSAVGTTAAATGAAIGASRGIGNLAQATASWFTTNKTYTINLGRMMNGIKSFFTTNKQLTIPFYYPSLKGMMGGIGGGMKGLGGGILGDVKGMFGEVKLALTSWAAKLFALTGIMMALHKAIASLIQGVKEGASVFQLSARTAKPAAQHVRLKTAFAGVGLAGGELEAMTAMQQFNPRARSAGIPGTNEIISAMRVSQYANIQQLTNMAKQFEEVLGRSEDAARQMESSSAAGQRLSQNGVIIGLKWNAMLEQLAEALSPVIARLQEYAELLLDSINTMLELWNLFHKDQRDLITKPGQERTVGMKGED